MPSKKQKEPNNSEILATVNDLSTTVGDILVAINDFSTKTEQRFEKVENRLGHIEWDVSTIKATMVTKEYLEQRLTAIA